MNERDLDIYMNSASASQAHIIEKEAPNDEELDKLVIPSNDFMQQMDLMIKHCEKQKKLKKIRRATLRIAACFAVLIVVPFSIAMSVDASRNMILSFFDKYFDASFEKSAPAWGIAANAEIASNCNDVYLPSWVPDGYNAETLFQKSQLCILVYKGQSDQLKIMESKSPSSLFSDNELNVLELLTANGQNYYYGEKQNNVNKLLWKIDDRSFIITSNVLEKESLLKIAQNLIYKE